jgi:integrase
MIFWRRRLPGRAATIFGRSHLTFSLRTRDPKRARQLSRRLAVHFDEIFDAMEQVTRALTNEQREAILQSFRDLIRERIELRELISSAPSEAQQIERVRNAPRSLEELNTLFAGEEAFLAADPTARAVYEERRAAHEAIAELGNLDELKATWTDALQRNDTDVVMPLLNKALKKHGISIPSNSLALLKLKRESIQAGLAVIEEATHVTPAHTFQDAVPMVGLKPSPNFSAYVEAFFAEKCRNTEDRKGYTAQTEKQNRATLQLWRHTFDDRPVRSYTRQEAGEFRDLLLRLPREHGKSSKDDTSIRELIAWADADSRPPIPRLKMKTAKRHFTALRQYWDYLLARGHVDVQIFSGFTFPGTASSKRRRNQWTAEALEMLFRSSWWAPGADRNTVRWWGPLILLHMGLRGEELCQLMPEDIKELNGIHYVDLNQSHGRRLKNESSLRRVPIHKFILDLGFLEFVERQRKRRRCVFLFPDINPHSEPGKRGDPLTKAFGRHIRQIGIKDEKIVMHSLRHTFRTVLANTDLPNRWIDMVTGHEGTDEPGDEARMSGRKVSEGQRTYTKDMELDPANKAIQAFICPIDLSFLNSYLSR